MGVQQVLLGCCLIAMVMCLQDVPHYARGGLMSASVTPQRGAPLNFGQTLDHFTPSDKRTFDQRYYKEVSANWVKGNPIFLDICGEGPCSGSSGYSMYLNDKYNGTAYALEHRFYGKSVPNDDMDIVNLRFLTVEQALADLEHFIAKVIVPESSPIIVIGGSYSGALTSWFRTTYPDVTCAGLASSGVVNAIYDFSQFDSRVRIAAGPTCADIITSTTMRMEDMWHKDRKALKELFGLKADELDNPGDFFYMTADSFAMSVQYGMKETFCGGMIKAKPEDYVKTFADLTTQLWGKSFPSNCFYSTQCLMFDRKNWQPTSRAWRWQKCTQLAYFQSPPGHLMNSLRSPFVSMKYMEDQCREIFGSHTITETGSFNQIYGGSLPLATNVYYSDFSDDPWQEASSLRSLPNQPYGYVTCDGCGHCRDLHAPSPADPLPVQQGRADFEKTLSSWISQCRKTN